MKIKIEPRVIYWTSFGGIDSVTLCLSDELYNDECARLGYTDYHIGEYNDGICFKVKKVGKRGECIIGIKDILLEPEKLIPLIAHEIAHAVDFIMEEDTLTDMEFRSYAIQDMLAKSMMYLSEIGILNYKKQKKNIQVISKKRKSK